MSRTFYKIKEDCERNDRLKKKKVWLSEDL